MLLIQPLRQNTRLNMEQTQIFCIVKNAKNPARITNRKHHSKRIQETRNSHINLKRHRTTTHRTNEHKTKRLRPPKRSNLPRNRKTRKPKSPKTHKQNTKHAKQISSTQKHQPQRQPIRHMDKRPLRQFIQTSQKPNSRKTMRPINKRHQTLRPTPLLCHNAIPQNQRHPIRKTTNGSQKNRNNTNLHTTTTIRPRR